MELMHTCSRMHRNLREYLNTTKIHTRVLLELLQPTGESTWSGEVTQKQKEKREELFTGREKCDRCTTTLHFHHTLVNNLSLLQFDSTDPVGATSCARSHTHPHTHTTASTTCMLINIDSPTHTHINMLLPPLERFHPTSLELFYSSHTNTYKKYQREADRVPSLMTLA